MQIPLEQMISICVRELRARVAWIAIGFVVISVLVLLIGSNWPRLYESTTTILADQGRLAGRTLGDNVQNASTMMTTRDAMELMFSRQVLDKILEIGGWSSANMTKIERENLHATIRKRTNMAVTGNLIKIAYTDPDPRRAFLVTSEFADQFIRQSAATSLQASRETYEFVDQQVSDYHLKLTQAEEALKEFRTSVVDASPARIAQSFGLIESYEQNLRQTKLALKEAEIAKKSLEEQLEIESNKTTSSSTSDLYRRRLQEMRDELDILRLSYHDTYPDIVRLKQQITDMQLAIDKEEERFRAGKLNGTEDTGNSRAFSTLYQNLRNNLSNVTTEIKTHRAREIEFTNRLEEEKMRAQRMSEGQAEESELVRDYTVNQEYYQNLLRRRENARLSMNLALQEAGLSYKVQEKANYPQVPKGLRFLHFVIAGPLIGLGGPIAFFIFLIQIDPRIRSGRVIEDQLELPLLSEIPPLNEEKSLRPSDYSLVVGALIGVGLIYAVIIMAHLGGSRFAELLGGAT